jgi:hypothetical protein
MRRQPRTATWLAGFLLVAFGAAMIAWGVAAWLAPANAVITADVQ